MSRAAADCFDHGGALLPVADALARLRAGAAPVVGAAEVALDEAAGRVLAAPLVSPRDVPAFDNVAVDGWAFAGSSLAAAGPTRLVRLDGRAAAGHPFAGAVPPGAALRALTGAPMPAGADTVAMQEEAIEAPGEVTIPAGFRAGANRRRRGEDIARGQRLFAAGLVLGPQHVGVAAELGLATLPAYARLRVALVSSGDELVEPGASLPGGGVFDANRHILKALLRRLPAVVTDLGILPDRPELVTATLERAAAAHDVIVSSGGASRGDEDHLVRSVARLGTLHFWQIAMKPGRPLAFGRLGRASYVGLPGNPVAATVCFALFARPLLLALAGASWPEPCGVPVTAAFELKKKPGRTELLRARLTRRPDGALAAERIRREGSGILTSLTDADGLVEIGPEVTAVRPGERVPYLSFTELGLA